MIDHAVTMGGMLEAVLALLTCASLCVLMFVLHRRLRCFWSRAALIAMLGALGAKGFCSALGMYYGIAMVGSYPLPWNPEVLSMTWGVAANLQVLLAVIGSAAFLGLAISQRRGKSRVARRRKT